MAVNNLIISGKECMKSYGDYLKNCPSNQVNKPISDTYGVLTEILSYNNILIRNQPSTKVSM